MVARSILTNIGIILPVLWDYSSYFWTCFDTIHTINNYAVHVIYIKGYTHYNVLFTEINGFIVCFYSDHTLCRYVINFNCLT